MSAAAQLHETDVLIAGGGVAGRSLQFELARRGVASILVDGGGHAPAASELPAAVINANRGRSAGATALDALGAAATLALGSRLRSLGYDPGIEVGGVVRVAGNRRQATAWRRLAQAAGSGLGWFEPQALGEGLNSPFGGLRVAQGGRVEPAKLLAALREAAPGSESRGAATAYQDTELLGYQRTPRGFDCTTSRGHLGARRLVLCPGAYDPLTTRLPRLRHERGGAVRLRLPRSLYEGAVDVSVAAVAGPVCAVVTDAREVVITGGHVAPDASIDFDALVEAASWYLPALAEGVQVERWTAVRARRPTGVPVARRLAPDVYFLGALGGRGFLTGPLLAARLADRLADNP